MNKLDLRKWNGRKARHGHAKGGVLSPEYMTWKAMLSRCRNPNCEKFCTYGGRGICVCGRWLKFDNFLADMGLKPSPKHTIERIDNDGNYEPGNCRWATAIEQGRNTRRNRLLTFNGETRHLAEWSRILGMRQNTILMRLRRGWTVEKAFST